MGRQRRPKGLTPDAVRDQLEQARHELRRIDAERDAYLKLITGYEGWLRLHEPATPPEAARPAASGADGATTEGSP